MSISTKVLQKRIPTLLGITVLVIGLIAGTILFSQGTGVFAPRANPQTTPKNIRVTNVTDSTFTISFLTDASTTSFVKYGTDANSMKNEASDDRVQLSADSNLAFTLHHITVRGLQPGTDYRYVIGAGGAQYDQEGAPFTVKTAAKGCETTTPGSEQNCLPPAAKTINGVVLGEDNNPAVNSIVYVSLPNVGEMSALIRNQSGNWAVPLSDARAKDGKSYASIQETDVLSLFVQGPAPAQTAQFSTTVAQSQPVATITFGKSTPAVATGNQSRTAASPSPSVSPRPSPSSTTITPASSSSASRGTITTGATGSATKATTTDTSGKTSTGSGTITTDTTGGNNNRGSTTDTGDGIEADDDNDDESENDADTETDTDNNTTGGSRQLAQATGTPSPRPSPSPSPVPFGTNNPFPVRSSTPSATPSASPKATMSASASSLPVSGAVGTTLFLILGGSFFILAGSWSFWVGRALSKNEV